MDRLAFARRAAELAIAYLHITSDDWKAEKASIDAWLRSS